MKILKRAILFVVILFMAVLYFLFQSEVIHKDTALYVEKGDTRDVVWTKLKKENAISRTFILELWSELKRMQIPKVGYYKLSKGMSVADVIGVLRAGRQTPVKITFNNVRTLEDLCGRVSQQLALDSLILLKECRNAANIGKYSFKIHEFIGMFLPNTYEVYYTISSTQFLDRMYKEYTVFWTKNRKKKLEMLGYSDKQVLTLASIVDEETNKNEEKKRIAGVYINRLKRNMPLQADPTLKFAIGDFSLKRILNKHKEIESPYNTYRYTGLPPGPIRQPSIQGIDAVLNYEHHKYFFFCAKDDFSGYHTFARTLNQHNVNARKYHNALNRRNIMR